MMEQELPPHKQQMGYFQIKFTFKFFELNITLIGLEKNHCQIAAV